MKVWPKNDEMRKLLKHPSGNKMSFPEKGPAEWPDDSFTARRVADGDVLLKDPGEQQKQPSPGEQSKQPSSGSHNIQPGKVGEKK